MADYGGIVRSQVEAYINSNDASTSASDSDTSGPQKSKYSSKPSNPRAYRLWAREVNEGMTVHNAIDSLGESYTSGKISRFEFENRTSFIANFAKYKPPVEMPFIMEEPESGYEDHSLFGHLKSRCEYSALAATRAMCWVCTDVLERCCRRL
jgi:hypothetical protein